ncbi:AAA family ATPase [Maribacter litoralis]|uniref:AAA family ATPase n=1 Tax=Maribacter litoralis TaxID=2059726 RepID=UPI003D277CE4
MTTKLTRFKVYNFRSIEESDWIEAADNSCLVGTNEAGKTNLLIALWKLNPANDEPIVPLDDFPRHLYSNFKADGHSNDVFIAADFLLGDTIQKEIAEELKCDISQIKTSLVKRKYDGKYYISFPYSKIDSFPSHRIKTLIDSFKTILEQKEAFTKESDELKTTINTFLENEINSIKEVDVVQADVQGIIDRANKFQEDNFGKKQNLPIIFRKHLIKKLDFFINAFEGKAIETTSEIRQKVLANIPQFVYYSDYGNLDSEIFLPRVIEDFERKDLTESARAKVRTLDVLFKYVKLSPQEIYELGNDRKVVIKKLNHSNQVISTEEEELSEEEIQEWADKKRERGILLRSAATQLTKSFKQWWLQGDYIFAFEADGQHFRINVSDSLRPEAIELEGRSRGLQWFFSFFLVFLVETKEGHSNTILLLDEPGLSLHPIAQYDLAKFFRKLSEDNQLIYTSHSPFLVDMDNLANVKAVYVDKQTGRTKISANLRYNEEDAEKSIYPIHAALGLTVSDTLLLGCLPVLVEGVSDQVYLSLLKRFLIGKGELQYSKEIVFIPTGGVRGMGPVSKLVSSREDDLPFVLLDSDKTGKEYAKSLKSGRYRDEKDKVLGVADFLSDKEYEIEDLIPTEAIISTIDRMYRCDQYFEDFHDSKKPIVDQIEDWAKNNSIDLENGWKVELARTIQNRFDKHFEKIDDKLVKSWKQIFEKLLAEKK